jgi:HAE1 family hydrophobic/amphiphilic exporter-1
MATSVATPLIKQFATIAGIDSISTTNSQGSTSIAIQFVLNRNIDAAAADVQAAIARAQKQLPLEMTTPPSYRKVNPADAPIILMALKSDVVPLSQLDAFAQQVISPSLSTVDGVAQVLIFGSQKYAVRIQIDPTALAARGIGVDELQAAITATNSQHAGRRAAEQQPAAHHPGATRSSPTPRSSPMSSSPRATASRCGWATSPRSSIPSRTR